VPDWFLKRHNLCASEACSVLSLLEKLLDLQEGDGGSTLSATHKLAREHLHPSNWQKMRVSFTLAVINPRVAAALQICALDGKFQLKTN
jgi:hypothetical protein